VSSSEAVGRLGQIIDRWIYTACLCFGLDLDDVDRTGFRDAYSVYQVEYSRNPLFRSGAAMDRVFNTVLDRTPLPAGHSHVADPVPGFAVDGGSEA
jgi:hypothetical protein